MALANSLMSDSATRSVTKKPIRHRLPAFLGRLLRRGVVRLVGGAVYVVGDLLDIAVGNGLDFSKLWPKELDGVKWPWSQPAPPLDAQDSSPTPSIDQDGMPPLGLEDFLWLTDTRFQSPDLRTSGDPSVECSIIIPVFNRADYTFQCLRSLWRHVDLERNEIIIVNNGSTDATATLLSRLKGRVRTITNPANQGFGRACNQGAASARGRYLVFLNNDTIIERGWLDHLVATAEREPAAGAVGSMLLYPNRLLQEAGGIVWRDGSAHNYGGGDASDLAKFQYAREVDYCSAASLLVRKNLFEAAGGFDERYTPAYYEDVDLCFSIRSLGFKTIYQPKSAVIHYQGGTAGTDTRNGFKRYQEINRKKFREKWRDVLTREHFDKGSTNPETAAEKRRGPRIIVSDGMYLSPNHDAGSLRMATILEILAKRSRPVFVTVRSRLSPDSESLLEKVGVEVIYVRDFRLHPVDYENVLKQIGFDVAILSRPTTATALLPLIRETKPEARIIYDTVDVHFRRLQREYEMTGDASIAEQAIQKREEEAQLASLSDQVWCVTEDDKRALQSEAQDVNIAIIPTIHALRGRGKTFDERRDLVFIGNFNHRPNTDAVHFFVREIFPLVRAALPGVKLYLAGSNTTDEISAYQSEAIVVMGYVPDIEPLLASCRIFVAPLRFGAGMKGKIGDALSYGIPVVTTSIGAEGLGINDREQALIIDAPETFAEKISELYRDRELWQHLSDYGYEHIRSHYTPERVEEKILHALQGLGVFDLNG